MAGEGLGGPDVCALLRPWLEVASARSASPAVNPLPSAGKAADKGGANPLLLPALSAVDSTAARATEAPLLAAVSSAERAAARALLQLAERGALWPSLLAGVAAGSSVSSNVAAAGQADGSAGQQAGGVVVWGLQLAGEALEALRGPCGSGTPDPKANADGIGAGGDGQRECCDNQKGSPGAGAVALDFIAACGIAAPTATTQRFAALLACQLACLWRALALSRGGQLARRGGAVAGDPAVGACREDGELAEVAGEDGPLVLEPLEDTPRIREGRGRRLRPLDAAPQELWRAVEQRVALLLPLLPAALADRCALMREEERDVL